MVPAVLCTSGGFSLRYEFARETRLRTIQKQVCKDFGRSFPATKAVLVLDKTCFNEFEDLPFTRCPENAEFTVVFSATDDPYFYDLHDRRRGPRVTLSEEVEWEAACKSGETTLTIEGWVAERAD
jgi:hypothetical protein